MKNLGPLSAFEKWWVPIAPISDAHLTGHVCLPSSQPVSEVTHLDGRIERVPEPFSSAAGILVFEDCQDARDYAKAFLSDTEGRVLSMGYASKFQVASMSGQQVLDNFKQRTEGDPWHVPTPVHHEWAGEVIDALETRGIGASTKIATERILAYIAAQN